MVGLYHASASCIALYIRCEPPARPLKIQRESSVSRSSTGTSVAGLRISCSFSSSRISSSSVAFFMYPVQSGALEDARGVEILVR